MVLSAAFADIHVERGQRDCDGLLECFLRLFNSTERRGEPTEMARISQLYTAMSTERIVVSRRSTHSSIATPSGPIDRIPRRSSAHEPASRVKPR
jgi:hypothetical protein